MSKRVGEGVPVLNWRQSAGELAGLWERVGELGWLPDSPRFVLQGGQRDRSPLLIDSAHSLLCFLPQVR